MDFNQIEPGFVDAKSVASNLDNGYVDSPSRPALRGEPLPLGAYTTGDTSGEPEAAYQAELGDVPLNVMSSNVALEHGDVVSSSKAPLFQVPHKKTTDQAKIYSALPKGAASVKEALANNPNSEKTRSVRKRAIESQMAPEAAKLLKALGHEVPLAETEFSTKEAPTQFASLAVPIIEPNAGSYKSFSDNATPIAGHKNSQSPEVATSVLPPIQASPIVSAINIDSLSIEPIANVSSSDSMPSGSVSIVSPLVTLDSPLSPSGPIPAPVVESPLSASSVFTALTAPPSDAYTSVSLSSIASVPATVPATVQAIVNPVEATSESLSSEPSFGEPASKKKLP